MHSLVFTSLQRIDATAREIDKIARAHFPYESSKEFLKCISKDLDQLKRNLVDPENPLKPDVRQKTCRESLLRIYNLIPYIAFAQRSSNLRLAFDVYPKLSALCSSILKQDLKTENVPQLVLSSEWDYSPLYFPGNIHAPKGFVLLGMPACESSNPMLLPLLGHEIGHAYWSIHVEQSRSGITLASLQDSVYRRALEVWEEALTSISVNAENYSGTTLELIYEKEAVRTMLKPLMNRCLRYMEETLADFMGLRLFGCSYLCSFTYLASPGAAPVDAKLENYPTLRTRIHHMCVAARILGITIPNYFCEGFDPIASASPSKFPIKVTTDDHLKSLYQFGSPDDFVRAFAENVTISVAEELLNEVRDACDRADHALPTIDEIGEVTLALAIEAPSWGVTNLGALTCAAWRQAEKLSASFSDSSELAEAGLERLKQVLIKCIEVSSIEYPAFEEGKN